MSSILKFDTLSYAEALLEAGFTEQQAKVLAHKQNELIEDDLATKHDLKKLELSLKRDMRELELRLALKLTLRIGAMIVGAVAVLAALMQVS